MVDVRVNESLVKYLAGLCDADASLSFNFNESKDGFRVRLEINLTAAESIDKEGKFIKSLPSITGFGYVTSRQREHWSRINEWRVSSRRDINMLIPRLTKHMVIKAKHWDNLFSIFNELKGKEITLAQKDALRHYSKLSRKEAGPLKHKKHPTWAWTAGYLDGDGSFIFKKHSSGYGMKMQVSCISHTGDTVGLELLHKAFKGFIYERSQDNCTEWKRNLGVRDTSFALKFLGKLTNHLRLKRYKVEQMIAYLHQRQDSQRLIETSSKE